MSNLFGSTFDANDEISYDYADLSREEVKDQLNDSPIGTFLIRNSIRDNNQKVLCVKEAPKMINNYKIMQKNNHVSGEEYYCILGKDDLSFKTIPDILRFYSSHYLNQSPLIKPAFYHKKVIATHDFDESDDPNDDLYFKKNEILKIIDKTKFDGWLKAMNQQGKTGLIPTTVIKRLKSNDPLLNQTNNTVQSTHNSTEDSTRVIEDQNNCANEDYGLLTECPFQAKVIEDYNPSPYDSSHIALKQGQLVNVLEMKASGLWFGEVNNKKGQFPFNRVEIIRN